MSTPVSAAAMIVVGRVDVQRPRAGELRNAFQGRSSDVADEHVVVARVHQEPGDHAADLAGAEEQYAVHAER